MRFITSIFLLLTVCCAVFAPYFIGHGIVVGEHHTWPWLVAGVLFVLAAVFGFIYMKLAAGDPEPETGHHH